MPHTWSDLLMADHEQTEKVIEALEKRWSEQPPDPATVAQALRDGGARTRVWESDAALTCCALSPDGRHVAAGDLNGQVHLLRWTEAVAGG